jgi:putative flippase GtrA
MTLKTLIFRYVLFAILATFVNLSLQRYVLWFGENSSMLGLALVLGTVSGLIVKYTLDKRWIFEDLSDGAIEQSKQFTLYALMGLITTIIFWGIETIFWLVWRTDTMRELGAIIGLSIGYLVKFWLDRQYVFSDSKLVRST